MATAAAAAVPTAARTLVRTPRSPHQAARGEPVAAGAAPDEVETAMSMCSLRGPGAGCGEGGGRPISEEIATSRCSRYGESVVTPRTESAHLTVPLPD